MCKPRSFSFPLVLLSVGRPECSWLSLWEAWYLAKGLKLDTLPEGNFYWKVQSGGGMEEGGPADNQDWVPCEFKSEPKDIHSAKIRSKRKSAPKPAQEATGRAKQREKEREEGGAAHKFLLIPSLEAGFDLVLRKETSPNKY